MVHFRYFTNNANYAPSSGKGDISYEMYNYRYEGVRCPVSLP